MVFKGIGAVDKPSEETGELLDRIDVCIYTCGKLDECHYLHAEPVPPGNTKLYKCSLYSEDIPQSKSKSVKVSQRNAIMFKRGDQG